MEPGAAGAAASCVRGRAGQHALLFRQFVLSDSRRRLDDACDLRLRRPVRGGGGIRQRARDSVPSRKERRRRTQAARQLLPAEVLSMLAKRIIPCLDVRDCKVTKGVRFLANIDVGDPVAMARYYYEQGADEIVFYDITASNERRGIMLDVVRSVAREIFIPFSVGGGLRTLEDMRAVLLAGAEKVSIDSGAVRNPALISEGARAFGSQC